MRKYVLILIVLLCCSCKTTKVASDNQVDVSVAQNAEQRYAELRRPFLGEWKPISQEGRKRVLIYSFCDNEIDERECVWPRDASFVFGEHLRRDYNVLTDSTIMITDVVSTGQGDIVPNPVVFSYRFTNDTTLVIDKVYSTTERAIRLRGNDKDVQYPNVRITLHRIGTTTSICEEPTVQEIEQQKRFLGNWKPISQEGKGNRITYSFSSKNVISLRDGTWGGGGPISEEFFKMGYKILTDTTVLLGQDFILPAHEPIIFTYHFHNNDSTLVIEKMCLEEEKSFVLPARDIDAKFPHQRVTLRRY